ncbi:hypothetical protein G1C98_0316 [Bifidobacterium sp. DSM 109960]|uniref:Uncharacterized protein n=1 Tax=Bifidobacterium erythrocebi TaxID=2675325 RepID=A0A7Y0HSW5_9BIFI|nr:hypothetical protein [Bifidobacterium sp. DSM 109960]NMM95580.1 hypothetical protein [Bifidobacterium sp. DSM 109960]
MKPALRVWRRVLWWLGLLLQLPIDLTLLHFNDFYLLMERILCLIPPILDEHPSLLDLTRDTHGQSDPLTIRVFLVLAIGVFCWIVVAALRMYTGTDPEYEHAAPSLKQDMMAARILAGCVTAIVLLATLIQGFFLGLCVLMLIG